jgi:DNA-binding transcriptional LysR family regulator
MNNLRGVDLNLLVTLEMLLTECNVTRAAQRLHLSQPSVSVQLRRLREMFGDPLLSPAAGGMTPTARGQALLPAVRSALGEIRKVLNRTRAFEPKEAHVLWQIAAADYAEQAILLPLLPKLRRAAPSARVAVHQASHARMFKQLESGALDVALLTMDAAPEHLHRQVLYREHYVLIARKGHPAFKRKLTIERFCELDHVLVSPDGGGFRGVTDAALESRGRKRRVVVSTQHFLFVPEIVAQSDLVAIVPSRLIRQRTERLLIVSPPINVPSYDMGMAWHERSHVDPAQQWLREQIARAVMPPTRGFSSPPAG